MKKIVYAVFIICFCFFAFNSIKTVSAEGASTLYYSFLDSNTQKYYDALEKMAHENMFVDNRKLDLVSEGVVSSEDIKQYSYGSTKINNHFELAKKAFFLDHEEVFYIDEAKLGLHIYINEKNEYVCSMGSVIFEEAYVDGVTLENVKELIKDYNTTVNNLVKEAKKLTTVQEMVDYVAKDNDQKTIKACLDELNINNYLYEYNNIIDEKYEKSLMNIYVVDGISYIVGTNETTENLKASEYHFSTPYYELNNIVSNFPIILENVDEAVEGVTFASKKIDSNLEAEGLLIEETFDMHFYVNNYLTSKLTKSQSILLPYPEGYGYQHSNIEYVVTVKGLSESEYVEAQHVATPIGIVVELDKSASVKVAAKTRIEENKNFSFIVLTNIGGSVTLDTISVIEENKNLKFTINADYGYIIDQILVDGQSMEFSSKNSVNYSINYEEIVDGSIVQILFIDKDFENVDHKHIEYTKQELNVEISGKPYVYTGKNTILTASTNAVGEVTYEWYKDGKAIEGSNSRHLIIMGMQESDRGNYSVKITSSSGYCVSQQVSEDFLLLDTVDVEQEPLPYVIIFSVLVLLIFGAYVIIDNATHDYSKDDK